MVAVVWHFHQKLGASTTCQSSSNTFHLKTQLLPPCPGFKVGLLYWTRKALANLSVLPPMKESWWTNIVASLEANPIAALPFKQTNL